MIGDLMTDWNGADELANLARSMLPPETTATILPVPARPLSAAAMAHAAGAFGDHVHALGGRAHRRGDVVERHHDRVGRPAPSAAATSSAAPTCRRRRRRTTAVQRVEVARLRPWRARSPAATPFRARRHRRARPACARASPRRCPTAARRRRARDHGIDVGQVLEDLEARRAVAGDEVDRRRTDARSGRACAASACDSTVCQHSS